jgi:hypothetical protein
MKDYNDRVLAEELADWDKFRKITTKSYNAGNDSVDYRVSNAVTITVAANCQSADDSVKNSVSTAIREYEY